MKVLMVNGSPHEFGCTYVALKEIGDTLNKEGIDYEILWLKNQAIHSCMACESCHETGKCVFDDAVNLINEKANECDGLIIGSPVHYASASGMITAVMDRVFYCGKKGWKYKPGAAVVSARRAGTSATLDQLNKYFSINSMPIVPSDYWNMIHGENAEEARQDLEGLQIMRNLGHNMAWMLKSFQLAKENNVLPENDGKKIITNFIR